MEKNTLIKANADNENTLKLKGVTKKQIGLFKDKKLPIAVALGLLGGVGAQYAFMSASGSIVPSEDELESDETSSLDSTEECFDFEAPTHIEFSDAVNDEMSFAEAYKAARADVGDSGFYNWRGSSYHTLNKEEWDALSEEDKQAFLDNIQEHSDFDNGEYNKIDEPIIEDEVIEEDVIDEDQDKDEEKEEIEEDQSKDEEEVIDDNNDNDVIDDNDEIIEESVPDEISLDDLIFDEDDFNHDNNDKVDGFVTLDEIGDTDDILEGLNDGKASEEADGIAGGDTYNPEDYETNNDNEDDLDDDLDYDNDSLDELVP